MAATANPYEPELAVCRTTAYFSLKLIHPKADIRRVTLYSRAAETTNTDEPGYRSVNILPTRAADIEKKIPIRHSRLNVYSRHSQGE